MTKPTLTHVVRMRARLSRRQREIMIKRLYVEKKPNYRSHAESLKSDVKNVLGIALSDLRYILRYDVDGIENKHWKKAVNGVFSEPPVDDVYESESLSLGAEYKIFGTEYLPGQYDQRADSAAQCVQLLTKAARPLIRCAVIYAVKGCDEDEFDRIKSYFINPVEARECSLSMPKTLIIPASDPEPAALVNGFTDMDENELKKYHAGFGFAMTLQDLMFVQAHFKAEYRNPTVTELKVIDTYWSDHCRHTTFLTTLEKVDIKSEIPQIKETYENYLRLFNKHHKGRADKYPNLMDIATMGARELKSRGLLDNLDESDEINACSVRVTAVIDGAEEEWLVMFKNETHNHPTEIEPFGGAATCLGGAIRDPLSGRVYVYQAMRITGAADINAPFDKTLKGKLPQRVISKTAAAGFSSYGNQIGLATGIVNEMYHDGYVAKRLETGFVVGAAPAANVVRSKPLAGDAVMLIGGATGRDGCGGATGSSKAHTVDSVAECGAEVQKGNPLTERKIQRLFRNAEVTRLIKKCNDFGAGGVCVAIGELSDGLDIDLDAVPKKYAGLSATELAISESQERMAVVVSASDADKMKALCDKENLDACVVAKVTDRGRMRMYSGGNLIVDLSRKFLDSNGVRQSAEASIKDKAVKFFSSPAPAAKGAKTNAEKLCSLLKDYNTASQKGLSEIFDSTIGANTVLMPFGGKHQLTPAISMAAKLPVPDRVTDTCTVCSWGCDPQLMSESPFTGAVYSVLLSVIKTCLTGAPLNTIRLTFQEFFERLRDEKERWGKPLGALLGALYAQLNLQLAAIGGKDSMSGSFEKYDVPPTLISFALGIAKAGEITDNVLRSAGQKVYRYRLKRDASGLPDTAELIDFLNLYIGELKRKRISFSTVTEKGGAAAAIAKSALGNGLGFKFESGAKDIFLPLLGDILISTDTPDDFVGYGLELLGTVTDNGEFDFGGGDSLSVAEAAAAFTGTFESVYPTTAAASGKAENVSYSAKNIIVTKNKLARPRVFIPAFPGTNCEYDTAKRFILAGAEPEIFVVKNRSAKDISETVDAMSKAIKSCNIIAFPGGFSGGDEPDGSGKFIATTFRNKKLADAVSDLLYARDGLAIGICNGFQALIKLGLLPSGKIGELKGASPTLTFNNISRHVSTVSYIRVASNLSPWLSGVKVGDVYAVAVSHGEGKFVCSEADVKKLISNGQIATQYADLSGNATMQSPFNPNGSVMAIEGITSADGRIYGKMGHSERIGENLMKNIDMPTDMNIFESGVKYFK